MLFSFEQFATLNRWLGGFWRLIWLNILWTAMTLAGGVVLGLGPASFALAAYLDRWFRHGETPPVTAAFWGHARSQWRRSLVMGCLLLAIGAVIGVNLLSLTDWYLRFANLAALGVLVLIGMHVFIVLAAMDVPGIRRPLITALLLGIGSLHWVILGGAAVIVTEVLMYSFAIALVPLLGAVLPVLVVTLYLRPVLTDLAARDAPRSAAPATRLTRPPIPSTPPRATARGAAAQRSDRDQPGLGPRAGALSKGSL